MRKIGNSLAYLLCQEAKCAEADVRVAQMRKVSLTGNSLAHLLCQEAKCVEATSRMIDELQAEHRSVEPRRREPAL
jgi:hypothetical protein